MSDTSPFGFGKFVPGFDFLQNLAKGTSGTIPKIPNLGNWVAPTLSVEELDKRIEELKAVQFWLEQNSRALTATVQALEVQKMTLATLKGMNVSMADMAAAFTPKAASAAAGKAQEATPSASKPVSAAPAEPSAAASAPGASAAAVVDPMQWWGALTQQFQQIATSAMQEATKQAALAPTQNLATGAQDAMKDAMKAATDMATQGVHTLQSAARSATRMPAAGKAAAAAKPAAKAAAPAAATPEAKKSSPRRPAKPAAR